MSAIGHGRVENEGLLPYWALPAGLLSVWLATVAAVLMAFSNLPAAEQDWVPALVAEEVVIRPASASLGQGASLTADSATCEVNLVAGDDCTL